jgi:hypothetical protein
MVSTASETGWRDLLPDGVATYAKSIDEDWDNWDINLADCTAPQVNGFIIYKIIFYRSRHYTDEQLWEYFREDFAGWTTATWAKGHVSIVRDFRDFLRRNGVMIPKDSNPIAANIQVCIDDKEQPIWTDEEIARQLRKSQTNPYSSEGNFNSYRKPQNPEHIDLPSRAPSPSADGSIPLPPSPGGHPSGPPSGPPSGDDNNPSNYALSLPTGNKLPPKDEILLQEITNLMKIYLDNKKKFGGEVYNILGIK